MSTKKIVCLGGGSIYFRRALSDLLICEDLSGSEIVLYDIDADKNVTRSLVLQDTPLFSQIHGRTLPTGGKRYGPCSH